MNLCLEIKVPILAKREKTGLTKGDLYNDEIVKKIYLSKTQKETILKSIKKNDNWKKGPIDGELKEKMKYYTRENIYDGIPDIDNAYWIFTNRSNGVEDTHSIKEMLNDMYYSISLGILDVDNNVLYYYEYDR